MPASSEYLLVKSVRSSYTVGIILRVCRRPGFLVRVSDSSGQEDDHGDEHSFRRRSADRGQHGAAGGVRQVARPGAGLSPVSVQCYSKQSKAFLAWIGGGRGGG